MYDYLIVGAGLSGAIFAHEANQAWKRVKVIDKRGPSGNIYRSEVEGSMFTNMVPTFSIRPNKSLGLC